MGRVRLELHKFEEIMKTFAAASSLLFLLLALFIMQHAQGASVAGAANEELLSSLDGALAEDGQLQAADDRFFGLFFSFIRCRSICAAVNYASTTTCTIWFTNTIACNLLG